VPRVSLTGGPDQKQAQSQTVCSGTWRPPVLTIALPGHRGSLPRRTFPLLRNSWDQIMEHIKKTDKTTQNTETGTLKKPMDKLNTSSTIHTSTVQKGPHPKLGMMDGRKPAANASATCASAPKAAVGIANALGPPAGANKYTYAEKRTAAQALRSHTRSTVATPSPEWLKKVEWANKVLPNYGHDKPTQEGTQAKRQLSLELPSHRRRDLRSSHRSLSSRSRRTVYYSA